jgi:hypothetical protein
MSFNRLLSGGAVAVTLLLVSAGAGRIAAQTSSRTIPRTTDGRPNLDGIWQVRNRAASDLRDHQSRYMMPAGLGVVEGGEIPYQPWAAAKRLENFKNRAEADPLAKCYMAGVPRMMYLEWPFQILQTRDHIAMAFEWTQVYRLIYTNGSPHDERVRPWMGDSRARWEGDTLVVEVANHNEQTWFDAAGDFHSDALKVVERYTMRDADTIQYEVTIEDPKVFTRPWKISMPFHRQRGIERILEYHCQAEKEEAAGDFEPDPRTWYPGPDAPAPALAFAPPVQRPQPWKAPASVRRTADGKPDLNGLFESDHGGSNYGLESRPASAGALTPAARGVVIDPPDGRLPYQPWARTEREYRDTPIRGYDDPTAHCFPPGVPRSIYVPTPFHIVQTRDFVATLHERVSWRLISLARTRHLPDSIRLWQGDSIGHWDGDTLVVETTNFNGKTWGNEVGDVFSHAEHVVERFKPVDANTIEYEATITDPIVYTRPFTMAMPLKRLVGTGDLMEAACREEERDLPVLKRIRDQERAKQASSPTTEGR